MRRRRCGSHDNADRAAPILVKCTVDLRYSGPSRNTIQHDNSRKTVDVPAADCYFDRGGYQYGGLFWVRTLAVWVDYGITVTVYRNCGDSLINYRKPVQPNLCP